MITTYQVRNVLRVYGNQLKKRSEENRDQESAAHQPSDSVDISMAARRKQILSRMSNQLISEISTRDLQKMVGEKGPGDLQAKGPEQFE